MDRAALERIGKDTAQKILVQYRHTSNIEYALAESIGEEKAAVETYLMRLSEASTQGDKQTAEIYDELRRDEQDHLDKLNRRLIDKGGPFIEFEGVNAEPEESLTCGQLRSFSNEFMDELKFHAVSKDKEAAAIVYREKDGNLTLSHIVQGDVGTVHSPVPPFGAKTVAIFHTHPSGDLEFSPMDYVIAWNNNLEGHCVIDPATNKRKCELTNFKEMSQSDTDFVTESFIELLSPQVKDREDKYQRIDRLLKKAVVPCWGLGKPRFEDIDPIVADIVD